MHLCACTHTHTHTHTHTRHGGSPDLGVHPFKNSHVILHSLRPISVSRERARKGLALVQPFPLLPPAEAVCCQFCPALVQIPKPFKKWPTPQMSPCPILPTEKLRMLLFWVVEVVNFKNLEESLLRPIHCLSPEFSLFMLTRQESEKRETPAAFCKQLRGGAMQSTRSQCRAEAAPPLQKGSPSKRAGGKEGE